MGCPTGLDEFTRRAVETGTIGYHTKQHKTMYAELEESMEQGKKGHYMKIMNGHNKE